MRKKLLLSGLSMIICISYVSAQNIEGFKALEIKYGRSGTPGDIFKLQHERYFSERLNLVLAGSVELSRKNLINYRCYTVDGIVVYYSNIGYKTNSDLEVSGGVGLSINYQTEKNLYKDFSTLQKINYGVVFQLTGEWAFTDDLSLTLAAVQRLYRKKELGMFQYDFSVGLKWKIW